MSALYIMAFLPEVGFHACKQYMPIFTARMLYNIIKCSICILKALCLQLSLSLSCYMCYIVLPTLLQIAGTDRAQTVKKAIESLFTVRDISTSNNESDYQVKMREIQMAFGILLESCGVMQLTKDEIERHIIETKLKLERSGKVNIVTACNLVHSSELITASMSLSLLPFKTT